MANKGPKRGVKAPAAEAPKARALNSTAPATTTAAKPVAAPVAKQVAAPVAKPVTAPAPKPVAAPAVAAVQPVPPVTDIAAETVVPVIKTAKATPTAAAKPAQPASKDTPVMATQFEAPKVFADINDRAQAAVQKSTKLVEEFNDFAKGNVEAIVESGRITAKGFETLGQDAAEYGRKSFEGFTATLKNLATVKSPADFFKLQSDYVRTSFDSAVAEASKGTEAFIKLAGDAAQPLSNRFAVAADKVKSVN
ncbi:phasin family protein [Sphingomonas sp.]|uniref:phasin family protein n=1 Tax=Sphingomonas sp. TaxID=28214 RepID=UPI002C797B6E|nr:phasin family protein [Sphingomonas sp.]HWK36536.1 phasin family protein [Sphingomonas sp.]